jgi:hypothetical protein
MAGENLSSILFALSQIMAPDLERQWNRTSVFLGALSATKGAVSEGGGKNTAFDAEFSGATAQTVAEGSDVAASEYASDVNVPATFPWCHYRSSFQVTETELDAATSSVGTPDALRDLFGNRILDAGAILARQIETDALTGTGVDAFGNPTLVGIYGGALTATGGYGNLNPATYPEWASNVVSNGGVARALTADLLEQVDQNIFTASSIPWNLAMTSAGVLRRYSAIFTSNSQGGPVIRMNDNAQSPKMGLGWALDSQSQPIDAWFKGKPVIRNAVNPSGKLALLNTNKIKIKYLPRVLTQADKDFMRMVGLEGSSGGNAPIQATSIPARIVVLAKTGDSYKLSLKTTIAMGITRRNACGTLVDLSETL